MHGPRLDTSGPFSPMILTTTLKGSLENPIFQLRKLRFKEGDDWPRSHKDRKPALASEEKVRSH